MQTSTLYIVATPIGNLGDISNRAIETLQNVDLIAAEDTRHSKPLCMHYGIETPMLSLHEHNEKQQIHVLLEKLASGANIALISDAGTPLISDPGHLLVNAVIDANFSVVSIPGPSAVISALSIAGIAVTPFTFFGFLPAKSALRQNLLQRAQELETASVFYESTHRLLAALDDMSAIYGAEKYIAIAKELTKKHENILRGTITELIELFKNQPSLQKGEFVIIAPKEATTKDANNDKIDRYLQTFLSSLPLKQAVTFTVELTGENKNNVYDRALQIKEKLK